MQRPSGDRLVREQLQKPVLRPAMRTDCVAERPGHALDRRLTRATDRQVSSAKLIPRPRGE